MVDNIPEITTTGYLRTGRRIPRNLYWHNGPDDSDGTYVGVTDHPDLSREICDAVNLVRTLRSAGVAITIGDQDDGDQDDGDQDDGDQDDASLFAELSQLERTLARTRDSVRATNHRIEAGNIIKKLLDRGNTRAAIGRSVGRSSEYVHNRLVQAGLAEPRPSQRR